MNKPLTMNFASQARLLEARKSARQILQQILLNNPNNRWIRRVYQRLCD